MEAVGGAFVGMWVVLAIIVAVIWILLPFAVFGIKKRLDSVIDRQDAALRELAVIARHFDVEPSPPSSAKPPWAKR